MSEETTQKLDVSRLNRKERRRIGKEIHGKILGRNLPYTKEFGTWNEFQEMRDKEVSEEYESNQS